MTELVLLPGTLNIQALGGDTISFEVHLEAGFADGADWAAQIRVSRNAPVDATFSITPPAEPGAPAQLTLLAVDSERLTAEKNYRGVWDCQLSYGGSDPVTTLVRGTLILEADVTRLP
jgi:hypothetical protein